LRAEVEKEWSKLRRLTSRQTQSAMAARPAFFLPNVATHLPTSEVVS